MPGGCAVRQPGSTGSRKRAEGRAADAPMRMASGRAGPWDCSSDIFATKQSMPPQRFMTLGDSLAAARLDSALADIVKCTTDRLQGTNR